ncbi:hypothetical protein K1719_005694 [Acacia pycnantha]|nr:hypothetical protein K1719_005694 [Acacia pycnantha]
MMRLTIGDIQISFTKLGEDQARQGLYSSIVGTHYIWARGSSCGVNYASGGTGILINRTGHIFGGRINLDAQIDNFANTRNDIIVMFISGFENA